MIINVDQSVRKVLTGAEMSVIEYINMEGEKVTEMSITELAEASYTSPATVSRAIRKSGFNGIPDLRRHIAKKLHNFSAPYQMNEVLEKSYRECIDTIENLKIHDVLEIVQHIKCAKKIYVLARGTTSWIAQECVFQLQLQKYTAMAISDSELMKRMDKLAEPDDLMIIFTAYNSTPEFEIAARKMKQMGGKVVLFCCKEGTPLEKYSDTVVLGKSLSVVEGNSFNAASRLSLYIISRTIIEYLGQ